MVNSGDAVQTRGRSGQATDAINFRSDVNLDGLVNSGDTAIVRANSATRRLGLLHQGTPRRSNPPGCTGAWIRRNAGEGSIMNKRRSAIAAILIGLCAGWHEARATEPGEYLVYVTNERSGDVSIIDGRTNETLATVAVGKRPRGIHCSPDGNHVYMALSGSPRMVLAWIGSERRRTRARTASA